MHSSECSVNVYKTASPMTCNKLTAHLHSAQYAVWYYIHVCTCGSMGVYIDTHLTPVHRAQCVCVPVFCSLQFVVLIFNFNRTQMADGIDGSR